jgi:pilus assembly protein Flp/PilA
MKRINKFLRDENGAALAEYGLLIAFIAIVCVVAVSLLGSSVSKAFDNGAKQFPPTP